MKAKPRANLLRVLAIAAFYAVELVNYHGLNLPFVVMPRVEGVDWRFHMAMTGPGRRLGADRLGDPGLPAARAPAGRPEILLHGPGRPLPDRDPPH